MGLGEPMKSIDKKMKDTINQNISFWRGYHLSLYVFDEICLCYEKIKMS